MSVSNQQRDLMSGAALALGIIALIAAVAGFLVAFQKNPVAEVLTVPATTTEAMAQEVVDTTPVGPTVVDVFLSEFAIEGDLMAASGDVVLNVINDGQVPHNLALRDGTTTPELQPGDAFELALSDLSVGNVEIVCTVPGHEAAGMIATLSVMEGGGVSAVDLPAEDAAQGDHSGDIDEIDWEGLDMAMMSSMLAFPAETEGVGNQILEPTLSEDGVVQFDLTAEIIDWEVEPGKIVQAWAYNGQVPGPVLKVDVGDIVRVVLHNKLPMGTDVHWHGIQTPNEMDGVAPYTQPLILSGETFTYEFEARRNSVGMYHAHHHGQMQVPNGMFGAFLIGDPQIPRGMTVSGTTIPEDLEIDKEVQMVLNDAGVIGFSLNGKSFPATAPEVVTEGDWVVINYYNEGLASHPMHLHQFPQLIFAKDGIPLDQPYYADTINIAPGERYSVLVNFDEAGTWVWHCHILTHVERSEGMFGMVTAFVVVPAEG
jgi:uncharacterized cupredoxin-like copper-binding protein